MTHSQALSQQSGVFDEAKIQEGQILVYRAFDIGQEIDLAKVEAILRENVGKTRVSLTRRARQAVIMRNAPLRVSLGEVAFKLGTETIQAEAFATMWDYGTLSIVFQIPIPQGCLWSELVAKSALLNGDQNTVSSGAIVSTVVTPSIQHDPIDEIAIVKANELVQLLKSAIHRPGTWDVAEDYVIFFIQSVFIPNREHSNDARELMTKADIPALLLGDAKEKLAPKTREGILENYHQYASNDLVLIDWNSALVVEPSGNREIVDILEFALTHLLELRYYDGLLDLKLASLYDAIEARRQNVFKSSYSGILRETNTLFIEFSEFIEQIDNSLKVVGDYYLAVIFRSALHRLRVSEWEQNITRKMALLSQVSEILEGEVNVRRSYLLELIIILLISFEIVMAIIDKLVGK